MRKFVSITYNDLDPKEQTILKAEKGDFDVTVFWEGKSYSGEFSKDLKLFLDMTAKPSDLLPNSYSWLIVSKKFLGFIEKYAKKDIQIFNAPIYDISTHKKVDGFYIINVIQSFKCIDLEKSTVLWNEDKTEIGAVTQFVFQEEKIPSDVHIFRPAEFPVVVFFSDELARSLEGKGLKGIAFIEAESI